MDRKGTGILLLFLGAGSFILPMFGLQFKILSLFGSDQWIVALGLCVLGGILVAKQ